MTQARDLADFNFDGKAVTINESSADLDFRVESNGNANMLFVDAGNDRVGIGTSTVDRQLHIEGSSSTAYSSSDFDQSYNLIKIENTNTSSGMAAGIQFLVGSNGEAAIGATRTGDGAAALCFGTRASGNRAERMRIDTSVKFDNLAGLTTNGNVTITPNGTGILVPKKVPAFYAYNTTAQSISDQTWTRVTLQAELFDNCNNFNTSNGRFTAPVNGIYSFTTAVNFGTDTASGGYIYLDVLKTTAGGAQSQYYTMGMRLTSQVITNDTQINGSILLPLGQDDYVQMGAYQDVASGNVGLNGGRCYFTGFLVSGT